MKDFRILSARRSYLFRPDQLRLTVLTLAEPRERIRSTFGFQSARIEAPQPTFGPVPETQPPGLVFEYGEIRDGTNRIVPIRFLTVDSQRLVIDAAGPSAAIDEFYRRLTALVRKDVAPDGSPAIAEPIQRQDISQVVATLDIDLASLVQPEIATALRLAIKPIEQPRKYQLALSITSQLVPDGEEFVGDSEPALIAHIAPRAGYPLSDKSFFSAAPLTTDDHKEYLARLELVLASPRKISKAERRK